MSEPESDIWYGVHNAGDVYGTGRYADGWADTHVSHGEYDYFALIRGLLRRDGYWRGVASLISYPIMMLAIFVGL